MQPNTRFYLEYNIRTNILYDGLKYITSNHANKKCKKSQQMISLFWLIFFGLIKIKTHHRFVGWMNRQNHVDEKAAA